ncbi:MAG: type II secretion system F family protein [Gemmataceae bacterium]
MDKIILIVFFWSAMTAALFVAARHMALRRRSRERVFESMADEAAALGAAPPSDEEREGLLRLWLARAGFRSPAAPLLFVLATVVSFSLGGTLVLLWYVSGWMRLAVAGLELLPATIGEMFLPILYLGPWVLLIVGACIPWLLVRAARRRRVEHIEQDLPLTLELLATLSESGIGFDAALERILDTQSIRRPLTQELRQFQLEVLAGRPRVRCLRRLSRRVDVTSLTIFVSALVQATQIGIGMADVLRRQVEDLRNRRRERALAVAAALPVKLLFPLVICFLPGIFVATLGPTMYQFVLLIDNLLQSGGLP